MKQTDPLDALYAVNRHIEEYTARNQLVRIHGNPLSPVQLEAEVEFRLDKSSGAQSTYRAHGRNRSSRLTRRSRAIRTMTYWPR